MSQRRLEYVWVACIAVLFNVFAMPLSSALSAADNKQLMWGGFCSSGDSQAVARLLSKLDIQSPQEPEPAHAEHVCCCSNASVLALLGALPVAHGLLFRTVAVRVDMTVGRVSKRRLWPSINPRASPV